MSINKNNSFLTDAVLRTLLFLSILLCLATLEAIAMFSKISELAHSYSMAQEITTGKIEKIVIGDTSFFFFLICTFLIPLLILHNKAKLQFFVLLVVLVFLFLTIGIDGTAINNLLCEECEAIGYMAIISTIVLTILAIVWTTLVRILPRRGGRSR